MARQINPKDFWLSVKDGPCFEGAVEDEDGVLRLSGCLELEAVPEFLGWLRNAFPEEFKKVAAGG